LPKQSLSGLKPIFVANCIDRPNFKSTAAGMMQRDRALVVSTELDGAQSSRAPAGAEGNNATMTRRLNRSDWAYFTAQADKRIACT
jgi:hypothetical protein